jgi:hypothetical protein
LAVNVIRIDSMSLIRSHEAIETRTHRTRGMDDASDVTGRLLPYDIAGGPRCNRLQRKTCANGLLDRTRIADECLLGCC